VQNSIQDEIWNLKLFYQRYKKGLVALGATAGALTTVSYFRPEKIDYLKEKLQFLLFSERNTAKRPLTDPEYYECIIVGGGTAGCTLFLNSSCCNVIELRFQCDLLLIFFRSYCLFNF
jgi:hypothetical protein